MLLRTADLNQIVWDKDSGICGICHQTIDPDARYPDRDRFSIDHIVPESVGGSHSLENLQASHLSCNIRKGDHDYCRIRGMVNAAGFILRWHNVSTDSPLGRLWAIAVHEQSDRLVTLLEAELSKNASFLLKLPVEQLDRIKAAADLSGQSVSAYVRNALDAHLRATAIGGTSPAEALYQVRAAYGATLTSNSGTQSNTADNPYLSTIDKLSGE